MSERFQKSNITAIVAAGGTISGEYARVADCGIRTLARVGEQQLSVISVVTRALANSAHITDVIVAGPPEIKPLLGDGIKYIPDYGSGPANFFRTTRDHCTSDRILLCVSDLPFITESDIDKFIQNAGASTDIVLGTVNKSDYLNAFPGSPQSTFTTVAGLGEVTMATIYLVNRAQLLKNEELITQLIHSRKSQLKTAILLGPALVWQWITGTLNIEKLIVCAEDLLHCTVSVVPNLSPNLAYDIDSIEDWKYANSNHIDV